MYIYMDTYLCAYMYVYVVPSINFQAFFAQAFKIVVDS